MTGKELGKENNELRVELKYCERCGALWLRDPSSGHVYCEHCRPRMDELPVPKEAAELDKASLWETHCH